MFYYEEKKALVPNDFDPEYEKLSYISYTFSKNLNPITTIWPLFPFQGDTEQSTHRALANI